MTVEQDKAMGAEIAQAVERLNDLISDARTAGLIVEIEILELADLKQGRCPVLVGEVFRHVNSIPR